MAFDGLLVSGSQVHAGGSPAADAAEDADYISVAPLSTYCKGSAASSAPPSTRLVARLPRSITTTTTSGKYHRNYQPRFCVRGRNVNAKSTSKRSLDDTYIPAVDSGGGGGGWQSGAKIFVKTRFIGDENAVTVGNTLNLPAISMEGPGFSHRLRSRSYYLAGDLTVAELQGMTAAAIDADDRVFTGLAWAEPDDSADGNGQTTTAVAKRPKKKAFERVASISPGLKNDVSELRIEVKKPKALGNSLAAIGTEKATIKRSDGERPAFDCIDSYLGFSGRDRRQHGALYHSTASVSLKKPSRVIDVDVRVDMLIQIKPVRGM